MLRRLLLVALAALVLGGGAVGCGGDDEPADTRAATGGSTPDGGDDPEAVESFCEGLRTLTSSTEPAEVYDAYDLMEANAPASIAAEVDAFVVAAREASDAFAPLGANASAAAIDAAMADLSPEAVETLEILTATSQTGQVPAGDQPAAVVLRFGIASCGLGT